MPLFVMTRSPGDDKEEARLKRIKSWPEAIAEILKWAGKATCRLAEINPEVAARLYKGVKIES